MPPYNHQAESPTNGGGQGPPRSTEGGGGPLDGSAIADSFDFRQQLAAGWQPPQPMSPRRHSKRTATRMRLPSDLPSISSSSSQARTFPHSSPSPEQQQQRRRQQKQTFGTSAISGSASIHPHIRELMERQQAYSKQQYSYDQHAHHTMQHQKQYPLSYQRQADDENVVQGLHMYHALNTQYHEGQHDDPLLRNHRPPVFNDNHNCNMVQSPLNHHVSPITFPSDHHPRQQLKSMISSPRSAVNSASLPVNTTGEDEGYVVEGAFQNKGCIFQTADDVGYLFGCGTKPQDEVVYVYNSKPELPKDPPAARANERNLFYHMGPNDSPPPPRMEQLGGDGILVLNDNVNDVIFQIDKEHQTMQAAHGQNMGTNIGMNTGMNMHPEFLRDPPPGTQLRYSKPNDNSPPHGHYRVVPDDDKFSKPSCSLSGFMDLILPGRKGKSRKPKLSLRNYYPRGSIPSDMNHDPNSDYSGGLLGSSPRKQRPRNVPSSTSEDRDVAGSFGQTRKIVKNVSDSVVELQNQLKAMVQDRTRRQQESTSEKPKESRQEPSPPGSPQAKDILDMSLGNHGCIDDNKDPGGLQVSANQEDADTRNAKEAGGLRREQASLDQARKRLHEELEVHQCNTTTGDKRIEERLRQEQASLNQARQQLQVDLEAHQRNITAMNAQCSQQLETQKRDISAMKALHSQQYLGNRSLSITGVRGIEGVDGIGLAVSPNAAGAPTILLSPLTAAAGTPPVVNTNPVAPVPTVPTEQHPATPITPAGQPSTTPAGMWPLPRHRVTLSQPLPPGMPTDDAFHSGINVGMMGNDMNNNMNNGINLGLKNGMMNKVMKNGLAGGMMGSAMNEIMSSSAMVNATSNGKNNNMNKGIVCNEMGHGMGNGIGNDMGIEMSNSVSSGTGYGTSNGMTNGMNRGMTSGMNSGMKRGIASGSTNGISNVIANGSSKGTNNSTRSDMDSETMATNPDINGDTMGIQQTAINTMQEAQLCKLQHQVQTLQHQHEHQAAQKMQTDTWSLTPSHTPTKPPEEVDKSLGGNDAKPMMSHSVMSNSIYSGHHSEGKFIDNVGAYTLCSKSIPSSRTPTHARSPPSRPNRPNPPGRTQPWQEATQLVARQCQAASKPDPRPQALLRSPSNNEEFSLSNQMLHDLKVKSELIRQDITRMRLCMDGSGGSRGGPPKNYARGVNVAASMKVGMGSTRSFPKASPTDSPGGARYNVKDPVAVAMERSDEVRSHRSSNEANASNHGNRHHYSCANATWYQYRGEPRGGRSPTKRRPPSPLHTCKRRDQEFYHD